MAVLERLIRNSDNQIKLTLTEDGVNISGLWSALDIFFGDVTIHRTANGDGVTLSAVTGVLTINPADLTVDEKAAIDLLSSGRNYRAQIVVTSTTNDNGAVFGGDGSTAIYFHISDKPTT